MTGIIKEQSSAEIRELSLEAEKIFSAYSPRSNVIPFPVRPSPTMTRRDFGSNDLRAIVGENTAYVQIEGSALEANDVYDGDIAVIDFDCVPKVGDVVFFTESLTVGLFDFYNPCLKISHVIRRRK